MGVFLDLNCGEDLAESMHDQQGFCAWESGQIGDLMLKNDLVEREFLQDRGTSGHPLGWGYKCSVTHECASFMILG